MSLEHLELLCIARLGDEFESMLWEESKICPEDPVADDAMRDHEKESDGWGEQRERERQ